MIILVAIIRFLLSLHKIGCALTKKVNFLCLRFALSLHKTSCTSAIQTQFNCFRFAQFLHVINRLFLAELSSVICMLPKSLIKTRVKV